MEQISESLYVKLNAMQQRYDEIAKLLSDPDIIADQKQYTALSQEYAKLAKIVELYQQHKQCEQQENDANMMLAADDKDLAELAAEELKGLTLEKQQILLDLHKALIPEDPDDHRNIYLEIRAGTGGDEAAIFVGDLYRMYSKFAEQKLWGVEVTNSHDGDHGGYKEIVLKITGKDVYAQLKFESGGHRVQRVPETESQGRVHTSACTVAVLPEVEEIGAVVIEPSELKIDTYRASGAGGQHVNTTDSAVRITHIPTGVVSECQDERSQHKNKARAMSLLQAKILAAQREERQREISQTRRSLVGSGDRSERIRTYNFPQGRLTDHRINLTLYKLLDVMEGELEEVIAALQKEHQADLLTQMNQNPDS